MIDLLVFRSCRSVVAYFPPNQRPLVGVMTLSPGQYRLPAAISSSSCEHKWRLFCPEPNGGSGSCGSQWWTSYLMSVRQNLLESRWLSIVVLLTIKLPKTEYYPCIYELIEVKSGWFHFLNELFCKHLKINKVTPPLTCVTQVNTSFLRTVSDSEDESLKNSQLKGDIKSKVHSGLRTFKRGR